MEATIKCIVFRNDTVVITQIEEIDVELGEPNCKLIKPCQIKKEITGDCYLSSWLSDYTTQDTFMIHSDSILTITSPNSNLIKKYIDIIS